MAEIKYLNDTTIVSAMTTELDSLAAADRNIGAELDNGTELDILADAELVVAFAVAPAVGALIELYILPAPDGTNYPVGDGSTDPQAALRVGVFEVRLSQTTAQRLVLPRIALPPGKYKTVIRNGTAQAFATSGNTLKLKTYKYQSV